MSAVDAEMHRQASRYLVGRLAPVGLGLGLVAHDDTQPDDARQLAAHAMLMLTAFGELLLTIAEDSASTSDAADAWMALMRPPAALDSGEVV